MSEESVPEEPTEEEVAEQEAPKEETASEEPTTTEEASQPECVTIPEHMKPLVECCREYDEGKIDSGDFFARALIRTGEFMQNVKKKRESEGETESE